MEAEWYLGAEEGRDSPVLKLGQAGQHKQHEGRGHELVNITSEEDHTRGLIHRLVLNPKASRHAVVRHTRHSSSQEDSGVCRRRLGALKAQVDENRRTDEHAQCGDEQEVLHRLRKILGGNETCVKKQEGGNQRRSASRIDTSPWLAMRTTAIHHRHWCRREATFPAEPVLHGTSGASRRSELESCLAKHRLTVLEKYASSAAEDAYAELSTHLLRPTPLPPTFDPAWCHEPDVQSASTRQPARPPLHDSTAGTGSTIPHSRDHPPKPRANKGAAWPV